MTAARVTGYPRIARNGDELVVAWTESGEGEAAAETPEQVKGAIVKLPYRKKKGRLKAAHHTA